MAYSTGRGGAGNIQTSTTITSNNNHIHPCKSNSPSLLPSSTSTQQQQLNKDDKKVYYSTGRGGAGNIKSSSQIPSPKLVPQGSATPQLITSKVSTGRGGYGNMINNDDPDLIRKLQDVDGPSDVSKENELYAVTSNKSFSIGRGGFGNVVSQTRSGSSQISSNSNENKLYAISSHGNKPTTKDKKKGFFDKVKSIFS